MAKKRIKSGIRVNAYELMSRAVEAGIDSGYYRAHKHSDNPGEDHLKVAIADAVMLAVSEVFIFTTEEE